MLLNGHVLSPLGCQNWALKISLWWKLCRVSWYLQLPLCGIHRVASSSQHSTPCQHCSLSLCKSCGLAFKGAFFFQSLLKWLYLTHWSFFFFFKYHFIFTWNEAVVWGSSSVVVRSLVHVRLSPDYTCCLLTPSSWLLTCCSAFFTPSNHSVVLDPTWCLHGAHLLTFLLAEFLEHFCITPSTVFRVLLSHISLFLSRVRGA